MYWRILLLLNLLTLALSSTNDANKVIVDFVGEDRGMTSINWNGTNIDFGSINISSMDAGYIELEDIVVISELSSNSAIKITATHGGWSSLPTGYTGNKSSNTGDVKIFVDNLASGLTPYSGSTFGADYTEITNSGNHILQTAGAVSGVTGDINARILLDWTTDIKGSYNLSLDFTVTDY